MRGATVADVRDPVVVQEGFCRLMLFFPCPIPSSADGVVTAMSLIFVNYLVLPDASGSRSMANSPSNYAVDLIPAASFEANIKSDGSCAEAKQTGRASDWSSGSISSLSVEESGRDQKADEDDAGQGWQTTVLLRLDGVNLGNSRPDVLVRADPARHSRGSASSAAPRLSPTQDILRLSQVQSMGDHPPYLARTRRFRLGHSLKQL